MELVYHSFSILLTFLLFVFIVLKIGKRSKTSDKSSNLPPGPWKLPLIGNLHQLVGSIPHHGLRDLAKKYGPIMHLQLGEISTIVVSSRELAQEVLKTHDVIFASRPHSLTAKLLFYNSSDIAFSPCADYWRKLRKICVLELLSTKQVQALRSVREEEISNLVNWIASKEGSVINLTDKIFSSTYGLTSRAAFGKKCKDQESFISIIKETLKVLSGLSVADHFPSFEFFQSISGIKSKLERLHQESDRILENIINEHKKDNPTIKSGNGEGDEDLVDVLLNVQEQAGLEFSLTIDNIKAVISDIFIAGTDASSTVVDWAMSEMIKNPRLMRIAQTEVREVFNRRGKVDETGINEMKFLKLVIKETLRLHPPAPLLLPRECGARCVINGFDIPLKTRVIVNAWAIGRDPKYWIDPEKFIPERFLDSSVDYKGNNFEYIPFGAGRRICPGMSFGMAYVQLPLAMLLYHFDWRLPTGMKHEDLNMTESFGLVAERKENLCLIPIPYHPSHVA